MGEIVGAAGVPHNPFFPLTVAAGGPGADEIRRLYGEVSRHLRAARPDVIVVFTTDHYNLFFDVSVPIFSVGVTPSAPGPCDYPQLPRVDVPVDAELAAEIQTHLVHADFDVGRSREFELDHTIVAPLSLLLPSFDVPIVPVFLSTSMRPIPSARRCRALGAAVGEAIARSALPRRAALLASGAFSFEVGGPRISEDSHVGVPAPEWVDRVLELVGAARIDELVAETTPGQLERAGNASGELLDWIAMLGAFPPCPPGFLEAQPAEGHAFAAWGLSGGGA